MERLDPATPPADVVRMWREYLVFTASGLG